jgi:hypothetical protein
MPGSGKYVRFQQKNIMMLRFVAVRRGKEVRLREESKEKDDEILALLEDDDLSADLEEDEIHESGNDIVHAPKENEMQKQKYAQFIKQKLIQVPKTK